MGKQLRVGAQSEIGSLEGVILHTPGSEVENMTPKNVERALYSDILNLAVVKPEYDQLRGILDKTTRTFYIRDLLTDILQNHGVKETLVRNICRRESVDDLTESLLGLPANELARQLIEGVVLVKDSLTKYLSKEYYALRPLHNFFFTRDAAVALPGWVLIGRMANQVRERESMIVEAIFDFHPELKAKTVSPHGLMVDNLQTLKLEGGDVLVAREDVLLVGIGTRTTPEGVDFIINRLKKEKQAKHIIVQELPSSPESFIHLDMVFTFLDVDKCMVYAPIVLKPNRFQTVHISLDNGKVSAIRTVANIMEVLASLGFDLEPVYCGGKADTWFQEREQWHSGANFFALGPGQVIGYSRNVHTLEEMNRHGFEIIEAEAVIKGRVNLSDYEKFVVTIHGAELSRGGGGCRCMTLPIARQPVNW
ncbi:MAG: arginine deiminase [Desulfobacteraceae bacterium]|nr:arginine deiminase [Desulfobacteraceae bacterium]